MADPDITPERIAVTFDLIARLGIALGLAPATRSAGCMVIVVDAAWTLAVNPHPTPQRWAHFDVQQFHCCVTYNGWPAGDFTPYGGWIAAGTLANEAALIQALERRLAEVEAPDAV